MEKLPGWQSSQAGSLSRRILRCICPGQSVSLPTIVTEPWGLKPLWLTYSYLLTTLTTLPLPCCPHHLTDGTRETMVLCTGQNSTLQVVSGLGHELTCPRGSGSGPTLVFTASIQLQTHRTWPWAQTAARSGSGCVSWPSHFFSEARLSSDNMCGIMTQSPLGRPCRMLTKLASGVMSPAWCDPGLGGSGLQNPCLHRASFFLVLGINGCSRSPWCHAKRTTRPWPRKGTGVGPASLQSIWILSSKPVYSPRARKLGGVTGMGSVPFQGHHLALQFSVAF